MQSSVLILFAIASILPSSINAAAAPFCKASDTASSAGECAGSGISTLKYCIKTGTNWICPTGTGEGTCGTATDATKGTAVAYKDNAFCCMTADANLDNNHLKEIKASECSTTDLRWCGAASDGESCNRKYCLLHKTGDSPKTKCPTVATHDSNCDGTTTEKNLGDNYYCCKSGVCPGTAEAAGNSPAAKQETKKSGASPIHDNLALVFLPTLLFS